MNDFIRKYISISPRRNERIRVYFNEYTKQFLNGDPFHDEHISLKRQHTARVVTEIRGLGKALEMNAGQLAFIEFIAWLHDIGRFEQYQKYQTFSDAASENHAELAVKVIQELSLLKEFEIHQQQIILQSILNHNLPMVPEDSPSSIEFYSRLLRDADKLDIWRVAIRMNIFHKIETEALAAEYEVPESLMHCFRENRIILLDAVNSFYDSILFRVGWIYNLTFRHSFEKVKQRNIVGRMLDKLPQSEAIAEIRELTNAYLESKLS